MWEEKTKKAGTEARKQERKQDCISGPSKEWSEFVRAGNTPLVIETCGCQLGG